MHGHSFGISRHKSGLMWPYWRTRILVTLTRCRKISCIRPYTYGVSEIVCTVRPATCSLVSGWDGMVQEEITLDLFDTMGAPVCSLHLMEAVGGTVPWCHHNHDWWIRTTETHVCLYCPKSYHLLLYGMGSYFDMCQQFMLRPWPGWLTVPIQKAGCFRRLDI
jgi:hypothetical protein